MLLGNECLFAGFCDASALPAAKRFVADLFGSRIKARIPPSNVARTLTVRFVIDAAIPGEKADVKVRKLRGQALQGARFLWGWSLGTDPARLRP